MNERQLCTRIRTWILIFIVGLILSGITAFPMETELAFIAGPIRQIPVYWSCIDSCFGILGIIPLYIVYKNIRQLEAMEAK